MPIPSSSATRGEEISVSTPSIEIVPASGRFSPERIPISVDFPAPFSPSRQCTSPRRSVRSIRSFASTPGNPFVIPASSTIGVSVGALTLVGSVCCKSGPPAVEKKTTAGGVRDRMDYLISLFTSPALLAAGILTAPLRIFARAAVISAQVFAGMYLVFSSEMPPFFRFRS